MRLLFAMFVVPRLHVSETLFSVCFLHFLQPAHQSNSAAPSQNNNDLPKIVSAIFPCVSEWNQNVKILMIRVRMYSTKTEPLLVKINRVHACMTVGFGVCECLH